MSVRSSLECTDVVADDVAPSPCVMPGPKISTLEQELYLMFARLQQQLPISWLTLTLQQPLAATLPDITMTSQAGNMQRPSAASARVDDMYIDGNFSSPAIRTPTNNGTLDDALLTTRCFANVREYFDETSVLLVLVCKVSCKTGPNNQTLRSRFAGPK